MQIKLTNKPATETASTFTRVVCVEKGVECLRNDGKIETLVIVAGKLHKITPRTFRTLIRGAIQSAKKYKLKKIAFEFNYAEYTELHTYSIEWAYATLAENVLLAEYEFTHYKSKQTKNALSELLIIGEKSPNILSALAQGITIAKYMNMCRDIANTPGGDMTPQLLAKATKKALTGTKTTVTVLDHIAIKKLGMGGIIGVGKGSIEKPCFIIVEYWGAGKSTKMHKKSVTQSEHLKPLVFVGKGITFDTGGLQVKPGMSMYEMHMDMSGGASVIGALGAIATLALKKNVIGLIPVAENAISDRAMRPGDVLKMMSGTTVDVLHTDAEGRLILADALHYAKKYDPRLVVDVATLTGASLVAVGQHAHVIMTKDRALEDTLRDLGEESGDYVFPLPLWDEYKHYTKGVHGDIANIPSGDSKYGGSINGGMFLSHFTKGMKWVHIDMAPRMTSVGSDKLTKGATGEPVRLLVKIAERL